MRFQSREFCAAKENYALQMLDGFQYEFLDKNMFLIDGPVAFNNITIKDPFEVKQEYMFIFLCLHLSPKTNCKSLVKIQYVNCNWKLSKKKHNIKNKTGVTINAYKGLLYGNMTRLNYIHKLSSYNVLSIKISKETIEPENLP